MSEQEGTGYQAGRLAVAKLLLQREYDHGRASAPEWEFQTKRKQRDYLELADQLLTAHYAAMRNEEAVSQR